MSKHRDLAYGDRLPESFLDALEEYISTLSANFVITLANPTTIQIIGGTDNGLVAIGINGRWRYNAATVNRVHPGGPAGTYDMYVTASDNVFTITGGTPPETDGTVYAFGLEIRPAGLPPATALWRKVGTLEWSGTVITRINQTVGFPAAALEGLSRGAALALGFG